ncbi:MAG: PEP-CTERM sorting domain-containing protein [Phycisphaerales bacterium JB063]
MHQSNTRIAGLALGITGSLAAAPLAQGALITFDSVTNSQVMAGETIGSTAEVAVTYEGDFLGWADPYFPEGDGAAGGSIYNTGADGVGTVIFTAASGFEVRVDALVLRAVGNPTSVGTLAYSLDEGATWTEVPTAIAAGTADPIDFTGVQASVVQIRFSDSLDGGVTHTDTSLDNINYSAILVPEPGSIALVAAGGALLMRRRRS